MHKEQEILFQKCRIGGMELKNRIVMAPMGNLADLDGGFSERQKAYYAARAKGGAALIASGSLFFTDRFGFSAAGMFCKPNHVGRLNEVADAVHRYDSKLALQFNLGGGRCGGTLSASEVPSVADPNILCRAMTREEIQHCVEQIGISAALAKRGEADFAVGFEPVRELEEELRQAGMDPVAVGDARAARNIGTSIREGLFAVLDLESN